MNLADRTYIINLAHRKDRWESVQSELAKIGYDEYERFDAYGVDHMPPARYYASIPDFKMSGWYGNKFSHYGVIEAARDRGCESVMVFEDDVLLHPDFNKVVDCAMSQLPDDWDWLQFGGNHRYFSDMDVTRSPIDGMEYLAVRDGLTPVAPNLYRISKMLTAHAYLVRSSVFKFILDHAISSPLSIDGFYAHEVHNRFMCYCVYPCCATQAPGMNDIGGIYSNYLDYIGD